MKGLKIKNQNFKSCILIQLILLSVFQTVRSEAGPPNRVVSLSPSITEIVYALGLGDRLVGVTTYCDYPEEARKKEKIGGMSNPSLEAVVSLRPDIVVMTTDGNPKGFEERLRSLKIKTYVFKARRLSDLPQGIRDMGLALGVKERADALAKDIERRINSFIHDSRFTVHGSRKKVLFIIWPEPLIVAGPGTAIDDAITLLGAQNIVSAPNLPYPKYSIEEIIRQCPDVIFIGKGHIDMKRASEGFLKKIEGLQAVKRGAVFYMSDKLYRLGPRTIEGIEEMARYLR